MNICCSAHLLQWKSEKRDCWEHKRRSLIVTGTARVREKPDKPKSIHHSKSDSLPDTALRSEHRRGRKRFQRWQADKSLFCLHEDQWFRVSGRCGLEIREMDREMKARHGVMRNQSWDKVCVEVCRCTEGSPDVVPHAVKSTKAVLDDYFTSDHQLSLTNDFWLLLEA